MFITKLWENPEFFFTQALVVIFSICCHEYAHARTALWQGDSTAADEGHLTLNPLKQMGVISLVMFLFIGIAWGAVPVNPSKMRHKWSDALVSFAGPFANLVLFIVFATAFAICLSKGTLASATNLFFLGAIINFVLFVLNMMPVPIFDGWGVLRHFMPRLSYPGGEAGKGIMLFAVLALIFLIDYIYMLAQYVLVSYTILVSHLLGGKIG